MTKHIRHFSIRPFSRANGRGLPGVLLLAMALSLACQPQTALSSGNSPLMPSDFAGFKGVVVGDVCNLRSGPGTNHSIVGTVLEGTWLDIISIENDWLKISYKGKEAWIAAWLVDIDLSSRGISAVITRTDVNMRQGPGTDYPALGVTQRGHTYPAEAKRNDWIRVSLGSGRTAWIFEELLQLTLPVIEETTPVAGDMVVGPRGGSVTVYQRPIKGSPVMATLRSGDSAKYITSRGAWIAVQTSAGIRGWVYGPDSVISAVNDPSLSFGVSETSWSLGKYSSTTVNATDVNFRAGPGTNYPVISMVQKGDIIRVLEVRDRWIRGISPKGVVGWVASWLTTGASAGASPSFSVALDASSSIRTLTLQGPFQTCQIIRREDNALVISTSEFFKTAGRLDINAYEFESVKVEGSDVTIRFSEAPSYIVQEQSPGKVVLGFAPTVTGIDVRREDDGEVLTVHTLGYTWPTVTRNGSSVTMFLPGASYAGQASLVRGDLVRKVDIGATNDGVSLSMDASLSGTYLLKKNANSLEAFFPNPGLSGKVIVVDPGHGGNDPGASGPTGYQERTVNWKIALKLRDLLESAGATVILTRLGEFEDATPPEDWKPDIDEYSGDLAKRAAWSQKTHAFVSIHNDWHSNRQTAGTTSYICSQTLNTSESRRLATLIQKHLTASLGTVDRGVKDSNFFVNRESHCPSVLVEVMYLSNPREEDLLKQDHVQEAAARGVLKALEEYFSPASGAGTY
ncbi:MAG: N-acetylmuramoyl-L-alanine amidase [Bacillota bacterium]|jgi:N-acetylmuramoyl-L-alanine amidase